MDKSVNEKLLEEQKYWVGHILKQYVQDKNPTLIYDGDSKRRHKKEQMLSHPFYMGLSDEYLNCKNGKRIMVIGREAMGYGKICDGTAEYDYIKSCQPTNGKGKTNEPSNSQQWAIAYLEKQLYKNNIEVPDCFDDIKSNSSSFWNFFRLLKENGYTPCWNNVDKVYFETTLSYKAEGILSAPYEKNGGEKSLLQREIKLCEPDIVLFVTGEAYGKSIFTALQIEASDTDFPVPEKNDKCLVRLPDIEGVPCFWMDHPRGLTAKGFNKHEVLDLIINKLAIIQHE